MSRKPPEPDKFDEIAPLLREFLLCYESQPGRAKQLAEEIAALLPESPAE